jgi:hypothetical protein
VTTLTLITSSSPTRAFMDRQKLLYDSSPKPIRRTSHQCLEATR